MELHICGRTAVRVIFPIYLAASATIIFLINDINWNKKDVMAKTLIIIYMIITIICTYYCNKYFKYKDRRINIETDEIIEYTSNHKENAYVYTYGLKNGFLQYSILKRFPDNTFSNLMQMGEWDTYTENYYEFKNRYNISNIMIDLYKKDNLYLIGDNLSKIKYVDIIIQYIKEHYNTNINYKVIKEFSGSFKVYKIYEES